MHQNDVFFIFLKLFLRPTYQNNSKHKKKLIFNKNKILIFLKIRIVYRFQNLPSFTVLQYIYILGGCRLNFIEDKLSLGFPS
jgi:hypothetical protein